MYGYILSRTVIAQLNKDFQEYPLNFLTCIFLSTSKTAHLVIEVYTCNLLFLLGI